MLSFVQVSRQSREADNQEREKARVMIGSKSPRNGPNVEQRNYCNKVCYFLFLFRLSTLPLVPCLFATEDLKPSVTLSDAQGLW